MKKEKSLDVFNTMSVPQAVIKNAIPAMVAMLMVLIYNLADTFFIGQTHNAYQVAAVSLATPVFLMFMAVGTVFGIGGTSVISRAMGEGKTEYAKKYVRFVCGLVWAQPAADILSIGLAVGLYTITFRKTTQTVINPFTRFNTALLERETVEKSRL